MSEGRAREGVEHLQAAAIEVIAAVRAFLDVAEDIVRTAGTEAGTGDQGGGAGAPAARVTRIRIS